MKFILFWCKYATSDACPGGQATIKIVSTSKMSEIGQKGGVGIFKKCLTFKNVPNVGGGGGVNPNWDIVPNFLIFFSDTSSKTIKHLNNQTIN